MTSQTKKIAQLVRHGLASNGSEAAAWSPVADKIADALTEQYVLTPRPSIADVTDATVKADRAYRACGDYINLWETDVADREHNVTIEVERLEKGRAILAYLQTKAAAEQEAKESILHEQRHEALSRILPEAAAANNLPAWDDLDLLQQRAVDRVVELVNLINGSATPADAKRVNA